MSRIKMELNVFQKSFCVFETKAFSKYYNRVTAVIETNNKSAII